MQPCVSASLVRASGTVTLKQILPPTLPFPPTSHSFSVPFSIRSLLELSSADVHSSAVSRNRKLSPGFHGVVIMYFDAQVEVGTWDEVCLP